MASSRIAFENYRLSDSDPPYASRAVNECDDENLFISELVDHAIRSYEELSNRLVTEFRDDLTPLCEIG
jgi:hypothetical protein